MTDDHAGYAIATIPASPGWWALYSVADGRVQARRVMAWEVEERDGLRWLVPFTSGLDGCHYPEASHNYLGSVHEDELAAPLARHLEHHYELSTVLEIAREEREIARLAREASER